LPVLERRDSVHSLTFLTLRVSPRLPISTIFDANEVKKAGSFRLIEIWTSEQKNFTKPLFLTDFAQTSSPVFRGGKPIGDEISLTTCHTAYHRMGIST